MSGPRPQYPTVTPHWVLRALARSDTPLTVRKIGKVVGLSSSSSVQAHIEQLRSTGMIEHVTGWRLTDTGRASLEEE